MSLCIRVLFTYISSHTLCGVRITALYLSLYFSVKFHFVVLETADVNLLVSYIFVPLLLLCLLPFLYSISFTAAVVPFCFNSFFICHIVSSVGRYCLVTIFSWLSSLIIRAVLLSNLISESAMTL